MSDNVNHPSEWVTIEEFPNYQITKDGKIRNKSTQKIRKKIVYSVAVKTSKRVTQYEVQKKNNEN